MWTGFSFYLCWLESSKKQQPFRTSGEKKETTHTGRVCIQTEACVTHVTLKGKGIKGAGTGLFVLFLNAVVIVIVVVVVRAVPGAMAREMHTLRVDLLRDRGLLRGSTGWWVEPDKRTHTHP